MTAPRLLAYLLGALALAAGLYAAANLFLLGFPDGHLTDLEQVKARLLPLYVVGSLLGSGYFCSLGSRPPDSTTPRRVLRAALAYLLLVALAGGVYAACAASLDNGGGG